MDLSLANLASFSALHTPFIVGRDTVLSSNIISHFLPVTGEGEGLYLLAELALLSVTLGGLSSSAGTPSHVNVCYERRWPKMFCLLTSTAG